MQRVFLALLLLLLTSSPVRAQTSPVAEIQHLHFMAMENYDLTDYQAAAAMLLEALETARNAGIDKELLAARTHVLLGAVYINGLGDEARAVEQFKRALTIAPAITIEPPLDLPAAKAALAKADAELHPVVTCDNMRGIDHQQALRADEGVALEVAFKADVEIRKYKPTAHLAYRTDSGEYRELDMQPHGDCQYAGTIPADAVRGESVQYFVSMKKPDGKVIAMRGNQKSPFVVSVVQSAKAPVVTEQRRDEVPDELLLADNDRPKPRGAGCGGCATSGSTSAGSGLLLLGVLVALAMQRRRC